MVSLNCPSCGFERNNLNVGTGMLATFDTFACRACRQIVQRPYSNPHLPQLPEPLRLLGEADDDPENKPCCKEQDLRPLVVSADGEPEVWACPACDQELTVEAIGLWD